MQKAIQYGVIDFSAFPHLCKKAFSPTSGWEGAVVSKRAAFSSLSEHQGGFLLVSFTLWIHFEYIKELKLKPHKNFKSLLSNTCCVLCLVLSRLHWGQDICYFLNASRDFIMFEIPSSHLATKLWKYYRLDSVFVLLFFKKNNFEIKKWNLNFHLFVFSSERLKVVLRVKQSKCYPHDIQMHQIISVRTHWLQDNISYTLTMCLHSAQPLANHVCQC